MAWLTITGLILDLVGASILTVNLFLSKDEALNIGVSRWASSNEEENLKLPLVQELLKQSRLAKISFLFITIGFLLQLLGSVFSK
jgi:hypothetical protein